MGEHQSKTTEQTSTAAAADAASLPARDNRTDNGLRENIYTECLRRLPVQRSIAIGAVDDPMEKEADHMADRVMRMPSFIQKKEMEAQTDAGHLQHSTNGLMVQKQDNDHPLTLPPVPHYQLQMPSLGSSLGNDSSTGYHRPDFSLHSNYSLQPTPRSLLGRLRRPMFQFLPPLRLRLSRAELQRILDGAGRIGPVRPPSDVDLDPSIPPAPEAANDGVRLGGDQFRDIITGNNQISAVARGLDGGHFRLFNRVWDVFHEPTVTFSAGTPGGGTDNSTQFGLAILNIHISRDIEFAPLQIGVDTGGGISAGAQVEFHSPDPHWSTFLNFGYSIQPDPRDPRGHYVFSSTGISLSWYPHFLNP